MLLLLPFLPARTNISLGFDITTTESMDDQANAGRTMALEYEFDGPSSSSALTMSSKQKGGQDKRMPKFSPYHSTHYENQGVGKKEECIMENLLLLLLLGSSV